MSAFAQPVSLEDAIYTNDYYLSIYPDYPPIIGQKITIRLRSFKPALKITVYSDREEPIPMSYRDGYWWGTFQVPPDYQAGSHFFTVWIKYLRFKPLRTEPVWHQSLVWYQMVALRSPTGFHLPDNLLSAYRPALNLDLENLPPPPAVTGEALTVASPETSPFIIKGSKTLTFSSKNIEGTKEGFVPGNTREETLRLNIAGKTGGTEINANMISTSTAGTTQLGQQDDKISVLVKRGGTEAYLGDFTADLTETEFTKLNNLLSGVRVRGDYDRWGFNALYSSPQGQSKFMRLYGNGTQGPYQLEAAPVVINSDRITVDGVQQKRGDDYTIDYQAGTVTFTRRAIDPKSVIVIYYDFRQTVYQHATYGLRLTGKPNDNLKLGATYLNDSDSLAGAAEIRSSMSGEAVDPAGHYVVGADGSFVSEALTANGEAAYSNKNFNLLSPGSAEAGRAIKFDAASQLGPFGLKAYIKRVGANFLPIADAAPQQDVNKYGGGLSWRPGALFGSQGNYDYEKYTLSGVVYENSLQSARASLTPDRFPSLEYNYSDNRQSNDPVTGSPIERTITRHSAESLYRIGFLTSDLKATKEDWLDRSPSEETTNYERVNFGLATAGLEKVTFTSNVELENRREPDGTNPDRKTYNLNLSASPSKSYFVSTSVQYLEDSAQGNTNSTDLSFRAEPSDYFKSEGKYNIQSVSEDFVTTEAVSKQSGSLSFDLRPTRYLRLKYLFKPNFTQIARTGTRSFNDEQQQTEVNLVPLNELMLGLIYKVGHSFDIDRQDYPNYTIKNDTSDTDSKLYTIKMAPFRIFSTEFNYLLENGETTQLATVEPLSYLPGTSLNKKFDAIVRTSLTERFSIDSRYTYQHSTQGSGEAAANLADTISHTASLKGLWNASDCWTFSLSGGFTKTTDNLSATPVTYTYTPGWGFIYRQGDRLRVDFDYTYSRSYAGAETEVTSYSLRAKYSVSDFVNVTLRAAREIGHLPDYRLTDITGNIEINL
jgi:hypothetical protein